MIWQHKLAGLIEALNRQEFPALFLKTMRSVADFDSSVIMAYGVGPRPEILHDELSREFRDAFYERYLSQAAFVLSPLYQTFRAGKQGFFHVNTLAPDGFFESRYYKAYYRYSGLLDQVFYLSRLRNDLAVVVSMARTRKFNDFDRSVIGDFKSVEPIAISLLSKHWEHLGKRGALVHRLSLHRVPAIRQLRADKAREGRRRPHLAGLLLEVGRLDHRNHPGNGKVVQEDRLQEAERRLARGAVQPVFSRARIRGQRGAAGSVGIAQGVGEKNRRGRVSRDRSRRRLPEWEGEQTRLGNPTRRAS